MLTILPQHFPQIKHFNCNHIIGLFLQETATGIKTTGQETVAQFLIVLSKPIIQKLGIHKQ